MLKLHLLKAVILINLLSITSKTNANESVYSGNVSLSLGSRHFVVSFLENIFGKNNISTSGSGLYAKNGELWPLTVEYILRPRSFWGGPCDIYEMSEDGDGNLEYLKSYCHQTGASMNTRIIMGSTSVREGYRIKACEEIISLSSAVTYALEKANLNTNSPLTTQNMRNLYQLFHPSRDSFSTEANEVINELINLKPDGGTNAEGWKYSLLTLCYDPSWQLL